jgi:hypothetical protein
MPDFDNPFDVIVDASNVAIGAVLIQDQRPVAYHSKKLSPAEQKWTTTEREMFAAVDATKVWRCYLQHPSHAFSLWTDHNPNIFFNTAKTQLSHRQARWQDHIGTMNFVWKYKKGPDNIADALTRLPGYTEEEMENKAAIININAKVMEMIANPNAAIKRLFDMLDAPVIKDLASPIIPPNKTLSHEGQSVAIDQLPTEPVPPPFDMAHTPIKPRPSKDATPVAPKKVRIPRNVSNQVDTPVRHHKDMFQECPKQLSPFEKTLWEHRNNEFFSTNRGKYDWQQDTNGLWRDNKLRLIIPPTDKLRTAVMSACHDSVFSGHFGATRTTALINRLFHWPGIDKEVKQYCSTCQTCQMVKSVNFKPIGRLQPLPVPEFKWGDVSVDMITDLPVTERGFDSILVFVDRLTKMCHIVPCNKTMDAVQFCQLFSSNIIRLHGVPTRLVSDRGSIFTSRFTQGVLTDLECWQQFSTAYHPQSDGQTERFNRVAEDVLRSYVSTDQGDWDIHLPMVEFAMNNSPSESTGQTPFILNYGINPRHPAISKLVTAEYNHISVTTQPSFKQRMGVKAMLHTVRGAKEVPAAIAFSQEMQKAITHTQLQLQAARQRMVQQTDDKRTLEVPFKVGDMVMLSTKNLKLKYGCNKLMPRFVGPFTVVKQSSPVAFKLELPSTMRVYNVFHTSLLKPYKHRPGDPVPHPKPLLVEDEEEYEVFKLLNRREKVVGSKKKKHAGKKEKVVVQYLVRWEGYGAEHDQWIPEVELQRHCKRLIKEYHANEGRRSARRRTQVNLILSYIELLSP